MEIQCRTPAGQHSSVLPCRLGHELQHTMPDQPDQSDGLYGRSFEKLQAPF